MSVSAAAKTVLAAWLALSLLSPAAMAQDAADAAAVQSAPADPAAAPADDAAIPADPGAEPAAPADTPADEAAPQAQAASPSPAAAPAAGKTAEEGEAHPAQAAEESAHLDDVVVTATKRREESRDIPISINAFRGDDLNKRGQTGLEQIVQFSPGVTMTKNTSQDDNYVSIRGVSADGVNNIYTRPTGLFFGDASLSNPSTLSVLPDVDPFDLETVEILKGPQGTLFGGSALSGAIRYIPKEPNLFATEAKFSATGGQISQSDDLEKSYAGMLNLPIGSTLAIRASAVYRDTPGWIDDTHSGQKDVNESKMTQARGAVLFKPSEALSFEGSYLYRTLHAASGNIVTDIDDSTRDNGRHATPTDSELKLAGLKATWDFGEAQLVGQANQLKIDGQNITDLTPSLGLTSTPVVAYEPFISRVDQPTYELRLVSNEPIWGVDYLVGLFYMDSDQFLSVNTDVANPLNAVLSPAQVAAVSGAIGRLLGLPGLQLSSVQASTLITAKAKEKALFFDLKRAFWDALEVDLGGRYYDQVTRGVDSAAYQGVELPTLPVGGQLLNPLTIHQEDKGFNPKLALTWRFSPAFSVYGSAVRGFRFGGINAVTPLEAQALNVPITFSSDSLWNYELGVRTDWFHGRMTADATVFRIDWKKPQILELKEGLIGYTDNVGAARSQGVEGQIQALLPGNLFFNVNGAYIDSRTTEAFMTSQGEAPAGSRMPTTPYLTGSTALSQRATAWGWQLVSTYTISYHGPSHNDLQNDTPLPSYVLHGLAFNLTEPNWKFRPELNFSVNNLFDKHVLVFGEAVPSGRLLVGNQPRTLLLTLGLNY